MRLILMPRVATFVRYMPMVYCLILIFTPIPPMIRDVDYLRLRHAASAESAAITKYERASACERFIAYARYAEARVKSGLIMPPPPIRCEQRDERCWLPRAALRDEPMRYAVVVVMSAMLMSERALRVYTTRRYDYAMAL